MLLLAVPLILTALLFSDVQSQPALVPANCSDVEKDAGVALDLINKHRGDDDGYVFSLLRVANAHVQDAKNGSILYLTLDVMETECPVLSRKHWTTCDGRKFFAISDFGQCKAIVYLHPDSQRAKLYGYNCTVSPVPPHLYKCVDCPVRVTVVEDVDRYEKEAEKILEDHKQKNNETSYFKVEKVQKVFKAEASRLGYVIEFIIKEAKCPTNETKCEFLPDGYTHRGFCTGRVVYGTEEGDVAEAESCEIYDIPDLEEHHHHHHNKTPGHGCRCSPPGSPHHHHHHHHHRPHHRHNHHHQSSGHRHGHGRHGHPHDRHNHEHHHGRRHHGQHQGHECPPCPDHYHHDHKGPMDHHNSSDIPPPPGPHYPPPPPGGPHHLPPSNYPSPPLGPPPPSSKHHDHPTQPWRDSKRGHWHRHHHDCRHNQTSDERGRGSSHEDDSDSFRDPDFFHRREIGSVHRIPVLGKDDVLVAPGANFIDHPCSSHRCHEKHPFPSKGRHEKPVIQRFPDILSGSCPGGAEYNPLHILDLYPPPVTQ